MTSSSASRTRRFSSARPREAPHPSATKAGAPGSRLSPPARTGVFCGRHALPDYKSGHAPGAGVAVRGAFPTRPRAAQGLSSPDWPTRWRGPRARLDGWGGGCPSARILGRMTAAFCLLNVPPPVLLLRWHLPGPGRGGTGRKPLRRFGVGSGKRRGRGSSTPTGGRRPRGTHRGAWPGLEPPLHRRGWAVASGLRGRLSGWGGVVTRVVCCDGVRARRPESCCPAQGHGAGALSVFSSAGG